LELKKKYDPNGVFSSDLGRRVGLVRPHGAKLRSPAE
jgi:hypothetical protein